MTPELKYKLDRCAALLAESPLDEKIKKTILENFDKMTEGDVDNILKSLERETMELAMLGNIIAKFEESQNEAWKQVEKKQQEAANQAVEQAFSDATKQA